MSFDTPLVEYLIIGSHTSVWLFLLFTALFRLPPPDPREIDAGIALLLLPFVYLVGMLVDSLVYYPLEPFRRRIRDSVFEYDSYKDEFIAYSSPDLYDAYDARVRRVRITGAAIFNWPLVGAAVLLHVGFQRPTYYIPILVASSVFAVLSALTWRSLYFRAYKFRKNACDVIRGTAAVKAEGRRT